MKGRERGERRKGMTIMEERDGRNSERRKRGCRDSGRARGRQEIEGGIEREIDLFRIFLVQEERVAK